MAWLQLTAEQELKLTALFEEERRKLDDMPKPASREAAIEEFRQISLETREKVKAVLSAEQQAKLDQLAEDRQRAAGVGKFSQDSMRKEAFHSVFVTDAVAVDSALDFVMSQSFQGNLAADSLRLNTVTTNLTAGSDHLFVRVTYGFSPEKIPDAGLSIPLRDVAFVNSDATETAGYAIVFFASADGKLQAAWSNTITALTVGKQAPVAQALFLVRKDKAQNPRVRFGDTIVPITVKHK